MNVTNLPSEPANDHVYRIGLMSREALLHYREAAQHYKSLLDRAWEKIQEHQRLLALLDEGERKNLPIGIERETIDRLISHLTALINQSEQEGYGVHFVQLSHEWVRLVKSLCRLYEDQIRRELDRVEQEREMPVAVVSSLRLRLAQLVEKSSMGVFANASLVPLLVEDRIASQQPQGPAVTEAETMPGDGQPSRAPSSAQLHSTLPVLDSTLRERTVDLFSLFESRALEERYDTILREIGAVVEDRLRNACGASAEKVGMELASYAFGGQAPRLRLSSNAAEQEGVHHLFRGFFGWVRNPAGHRLLGKVSKERVLQVLGFADYLLGLLGEGGP